MRLSLKPKCTCHTDDPNRHYLYCDLMYIRYKSFPAMRKRFFIFYPLKKVKK